ncbi:hypothetical protein K7432_010486 [Basidiobolus ranarum]|uniref:Uncharacterized protein n=1 Tax=Basidiobolus ranarum TaxID=34480 RepID=A0ABR2VVI7_9FUNG
MRFFAITAIVALFVASVSAQASSSPAASGSSVTDASASSSPTPSGASVSSSVAAGSATPTASSGASNGIKATGTSVAAGGQTGRPNSAANVGAGSAMIGLFMASGLVARQLL